MAVIDRVSSYMTAETNLCMQHHIYLVLSGLSKKPKCRKIKFQKIERSSWKEGEHIVDEKISTTICETEQSTLLTNTTN